MSNNFNVKDERNLTMLTDFYELTMGNGYFKNGLGNKIACFDMYFRRVPDEGGYCIMSGVEQLIQYIQELEFTDKDIDFLRKQNLFCEEFLDYLKNFKFECDVYAIPEGNPVFPNEPLVSVKGPVIQAQFVETMILLTVNHQTLIATKANRIVRAADGRPVLEFGSRRAQGYDGATYGARAAMIGGCSSTANTLAAMKFNVPASGTMAHSWIQLFDDEYEAFKAYAEVYPDSTTLLVDTYNVLKSGVPNAIKVFDNVLKPLGKRPKAVRIDSGDITYLCKETRKMLDNAGYEDCKILVSNSLDEYIIRDVLNQGAPIDAFGVGERLITARSEPVFGGVYKLVASEENGNLVPRIKLSENVEKITTPGFKKLYRFYTKKDNKAIADLITLSDEKIDESKPYTLFDPVSTWKKKTVRNYYVKELQVQLFDKGKLIYDTPTVSEIREYSKKELDKFWEEIKRFENPHSYYVDLSDKLWSTKNDLLQSLADRFDDMEE